MLYIWIVSKLSKDLSVAVKCRITDYMQGTEKQGLKRGNKVIKKENL